MTPRQTVSMCRNQIYETLIRPLLFQMDAEQAHHLAHKLALAGKPVLPGLSGCFTYKGNDLQISIAGNRFSNPVGLAAGFDKNGQLVSVLGRLGFAFAEIGSITARPSLGNPQPRLFRLPQDEALINRLGLNGDGAESVAHHLQNESFSLPIGINIAKTHDPNIQGDAAIEDILFSFKQVKNLPIKFITINASCPNTKEGQLAEKHNLSVIFAEIQKSNSAGIPIFVKLSPDSSPELLENIIGAAIEFKLAGYVCGNTTTSRNNLKTPAAEIESIGMGGLSGVPLKQLSIDLVSQVYKQKSAEQAIIGCGGITTGQDAYDFICAGATAVEIYTSLVYHGPHQALDINQELSRVLKLTGQSLSEAVGSSHK